LEYGNWNTAIGIRQLEYGNWNTAIGIRQLECSEMDTAAGLLAVWDVSLWAIMIL